jgi:2-polyprenyl-3-methyl-5-hydroxy-6-metoxy-1,4-benzoquinol methylase
VWQNRMLETEAHHRLDAIRKIISRTANHQARAAPFKSFAAAAAKSLGENQEPQPSELTRNEKVLYGLNLSGFGLEIGPSYSPVASKRAGFNVEILDHADADTLRKKYQRLNVDISYIEEVDYVWAGEPLNQLTEKAECYDWIIASHVIEHTPDLIAFLQQCEVMLKPGGILSLAIPDHRYCFDRFRAANTPGDIIQAHLEQRRRHTAGVIWDHFSMIARKGETVSWEAGHTGDFTLIHSIEEAKEMFLKAKSSESYIDVHNWRFTPSSFRLILEDIGFLGFSRLVIRSVFPTVGCEFLVQLEKVNMDARVNTVDVTSRLKILQQALSENLAGT